MSLLPIETDIPFRNISKLVVSNSAFVNPFANVLTATNSSLSGLSTYITNASTIGNPSYNVGIAVNAVQINNAINSLITTVNRFTSHSNNLSGISLSNGLNGANFATISTIVSTVKDYRNDGSICELVYDVFGAIVKAGEIINEINILLNQITNVVNLANQIAGNLDYIRTLLENQIESDLSAFAITQIEALQYAASAAINALIGNVCISEVLTQIGSQELKTIVKERSKEVFK